MYVAGALALALVAAGVFVGTDLVELPWLNTSSSIPSVPQLPSTSTPSLPQAQLVAPMTEAASAGGFAASFAAQGGGSWELTPGHRLERLGLNGGGTVFARLSSGIALDKSQIIDGTYVELPAEFAQQSAGKRIEVGIVARAAQSNPSNEFSVLYSTRQAGNSGWRTFQAGSNFEIRSFTFDVPAAPNGYDAKPAIAVRGDSQGKGLGLEIIGVYAKLAGQPISASSFGTQYRIDFSPGNTAKWMVPAGHSLSAVSDPRVNVPLARLTGSQPLKPQEPMLGTQGPSVLVPSEVAARLNGRKINLVVRARAASSNSGGGLRIVFATQKAGHTGWLTVPLTTSIESHTLSYAVPKVADGYSDPFLIVIHAEGAEHAIDIESIEIVATDLN
jgi:hypothetical protein